MRSPAILRGTVLVLGVLTQAGCELPLESQGVGGSGGSADDGPDITVGVQVSVGGTDSSCTCGGADGGADASSGSTSSSGGSTTGGGAGGEGASTGSTSGAGGEGASTGSTSGAGGEGAGSGSTSGAGGEGAGSGSTSGSGGEGAGTSSTSGSGGEGPGSTSGAGGEGAGTSSTSGSGGEGPGSTSGAGGDATGTSSAGAGGEGSTGAGPAGGTGGAGTGAGGGEAGSGGAGGEAPTACPGEPYTLHNGDTIVIAGDTAGAPDLIDTCWDAEDGGERVYELTLAQGGTLILEVEEDGDLDAALVLLETCGVLDPQQCYNFSSEGERVAFHTEPRTLTAIVDAMNAVDGAFTLTATLTKAACGDGVINPGEDCDVGAAVPNDGCGDPGTVKECQVVATTSSYDVCPGEPVALPSGATMLAMDSHTTLGFADDYIGNCMPEVGGPERVFAATPAVSGTLTVKVGFDVDGVTSWCSQDFSHPGCFDVEMYVRSSCESPDPQDEIACASSCCDGETLSFPVTAGEPVYVFVDGYDAESYSSGPFNLHFDLLPLVD